MKEVLIKVIHKTYRANKHDMVKFKRNIHIVAVSVGMVQNLQHTLFLFFHTEVLEAGLLLNIFWKISPYDEKVFNSVFLESLKKDV